MTDAVLQNFDEDDDFEENSSTGQLTPKLDAVTSPPLPPALNDNTLHSSLWEPFCLDLSMANADAEQVCGDYSITQECLLDLLANATFIARLREAKARVKSLGPNAGFILTAHAQAAKHLVTLGSIADSQSTHASIRVKAIENIVRYAHLDPATTKKDKDMDTGGVSVQFNIGGNLLGNDRRTIDLVAEVPQGTQNPPTQE